MPTVRDPLNPKISLWHMLAYLLRWEREKNGLSLAQWGKIASAAPSTVSNIDSRDIAYAGARRGGRLIEMCDEVDEFRLDFDLIGQKAASDDASRVLIERRLEAIE